MRERNGRIYLDYHASTPVDPRVVEVVVRCMSTCFGNPGSADHVFGDEAAAVVEAGAASVGALVGAHADDVVFTSGATESINLALKGMVAAAGGRRPLRVLVSPTEHTAVLQTCAVLARQGAFDLHWLHVDGLGRVDLSEIERECRAGTDLVCVMAANNEIGTVAPAETIAALARQYGAAYLCDASQAGGRVPLTRLGALGAFVVLSGHKMYAPKGVGALVAPMRRHLRAVIHGGEQQGGLRGGTQNVPGIAGLGEACRLRREEMVADEQRISDMRDRLQRRLLADVPELVVNGDPDARLAGNLHVSVPTVPNGAVIARVRMRLAIATGSACTSGIEAPSHVLRAISLPDSLQDGALRIGIGKWTTSDEIDEAAGLLSRTIRAISSPHRHATKCQD